MEIASIVLSTTSPDNSTRNETLSQSPFPAYLTTSQHSLTFPRSLTSAFMNSTDATTQDNDFSEPSLHLPSSSTNYTLTITLSSGLVVTIPADEMRNASNATPLSETPSSLTSPGSRNGGNNETSDEADNEGSVLLGTAFLHHLYLVAQYSSSAESPPKFHLNTVDPHAPYVLPEPLCVGTVPREGQAVPGGGLSSWERNGIIGAVLGGVIGGFAVGWVCWWCWVRRRRSRGGGWRSVDGAKERRGEGTDGRGTGETRDLGKQWADAEDEEMRGWVLFAGRFGLGRGGKKGKGKGKGKMEDGYQDVEGKSVDGSSDDDGSGNGYGMQNFSPVAIPAAYGDGGHDRGFNTSEPTAFTHAGTTASVPAVEIPFDFTPHTSTDTNSPNSLTDLSVPIFPAITPHHSSDQDTATPYSLTSPSSVSWHEVTDVGRAISTPALLVDIGRSKSGSRPATATAFGSDAGAGSDQSSMPMPSATPGPASTPTVVAVRDDGGEEQGRARSMTAVVVEGEAQAQAPAQRHREADALTLRSISPVSPLMEDAMFWGGSVPFPAVASSQERETRQGQMRDDIVGGEKTDEGARGAESWILSHRGSELGLLAGYTGEARTGAEIKIKNKIPRKMVRGL